MATPTQTPNDRYTDESHDPSQQLYDREFNNIAGNYDKTADPAKENSNIDQLRGSEKNVDSPEKVALNETAAGKTAEQAASVIASPLAGKVVSFIGKVRLNKKTAGAGGLVALLVVLGILGFSSLSLGPITFFTIAADDLNDQLSALDTSSDNLMRTKISTTERERLLAGCATKMSIRCKYKSQSSKDVERFKASGIEVKGTKVAGRTFPTEYVLKGKSYSPREFASAIKTEPSVKLAARTALNMRSLGFKDKVYSKVMERFGVSKAKPKLTGDVEEEFKSLATGEKSPAVVGDESFVPIGEDKDGNKTYQSPDGKIITQKQLDAIIGTGIPDVVKGAGVKSLAQFAKVVNITGYQDILCSLQQTIGYASTAAKVAKYVKMAQYVAPVAASVYAIKAGDGTDKDGEVIGKFFMQADGRRKVVDESATASTGIETSGGSVATEASFKTIKKDNPYYGKNAMDSPLYKLSSSGGLKGINDEGTAKYSLALSTNKVASTLGTIATFMSLGAIGQKTCDFVQNWGVRGVSLIVGIAAMFTGIGEANVLKNLAVAAGVTVAFILVAGFLTSVTQQQPVPDDITDAPEERAAATWTGLSALTAETARTSGLMPANAADIVAYQAENKKSLAYYGQMEASKLSPWDTSSPYTAASKLAIAAQKYEPTSNSVSGYMASLGNILGSSISAPFTTHAATVSTDRFKKCDDDEYKKMGIDADVQCNIRYVMPAADLALDPDEVAKYMEDNNYVEDSSETGLPPGYTLPTASQMNIGLEILKGAVNSVYNTRNYVNDYGKFLDFCAYRSLPWGETFQETGAFGAAGDEWVSGRKCMDKTDYKMRAFRAYTLNNRVTDINEDPQAVVEGDAAPVTNSSAAVLAKKILDLRDQGKISISDYSTDKPADVATRSLASMQLQDIADGKPVGITTRCPDFQIDGPIVPDTQLLSFLATLGEKYHYTISVLFGQCHTSAQSNHYKGKAVDFECKLDLTIADKVGSLYGVSRNSESCPGDAHWHYSVGGN